MAQGQPAAQQLRGHVPAAVSRLQPVERLPASQHLDLTIGLPLRNQPELARLLRDLYDPASPRYRQFLSAQDFASRFAPREQDYAKIAAFAQAHQLTITGTHPNRTLLDVNGSVALIESAFHLKLNRYQHPTENRAFFAPNADPTLDLDTPVLSISGLDDFVLARPMQLRKGAFGPLGGLSRSYAGLPAISRGQNATADDSSNPSAIDYATGSGPGYYFIGKDFREAYAPGVSLYGSGQAIGLFELDGYYPSDITAYESLAGLPNVAITNVLLDNFSGQPGANNVEVALDIDMAICMAPGSQIIVYEGKTPNDVLNRMAADNKARQLGCSWGFGSQVDPVREQIYQQFAAQGQSMFQAAGDLGAWTGPIYPPSDDPWLTVVGGTSLTTAGRGGAWVSESVWPFGGGGISTAYAIPLWQQGLNMSANQGSTTMRNIPDVACLADAVIWLVANNGQEGTTGGTSASAPLWAGFMALVNQEASATFQPSPGFINPAVYAIGSGLDYPLVFHDITSGNNTNSSSPTNFFAVAGYDLCTGWGTPAGSNFIGALLAPPDALAITPKSALVFSGPASGPFSPAVQSYSLTNFGSTTLSWGLLNTSVWLSVSNSGGSLSPGGPSSTVAFSPNSTASNLPPGSYTGTVWFTNLSNHFAQSREVTLAFFTPPQIIAQPTNLSLFASQTASFTVGIASNALVSYQWRYDNGSDATNLSDGENIMGSATGTLTISNATEANVGAYFVVVSNAAGTVTSSDAYLAIIPWRPVITAEPAAVSALPGQSVTLTVTAAGSQPLRYQWQDNGTNVTDAGNISGSRTSALTFTNVTVANAGVYSVVVSNAMGAVASTGAVLSVASVTAPTAALSVLHNFSGANDGSNPNGLLQGAGGSFYGTTLHGGTNAAGTVFQMNPRGDIQSLYSFSGINDGALPAAPLIQGSDGSLFSTTFGGGAYGLGTVFHVATNGSLASLVSFNYDHTNGILPYAGLTQGPDGDFYGTAYEGGTNGFYGSVFRVTPGGALTNLYSFSNGKDGSYPYAGLLLGADGNFYGTTYNGGAHNCGTVFRINFLGTLTTLAAFNVTNGAFPYASLAQGDDGNFYGVASGGGAHGQGVVFELTAGGLLTNLYSFSGPSDGRRPMGGLVLGGDGNWYGTTANGGAYDDGTIFWMPPHGTPQVLAQFNGYNGANPQATLTPGSDGGVYGTTRNGGAAGMGTAFRLGVMAAPQITCQPTNQSVFSGANVTFNVAVFGTQPMSYQWQLNGTNLTDGGNVSGSTNRLLKLSAVDLVGNSGFYSVLVSNALGSAASALALLEVEDAPAFITAQPTNQSVAPGATVTFSVSATGSQPLGYQWRCNGTNLADSGNIYGSSTSTLTLYGVTETYNGTYSVLVSNAINSELSEGAVLLVIPPSGPGTLLATLYSFEGGLSQPSALSLASDGNLYGTTTYGGNQPGYGTVFSVATTGIVNIVARFATNTGISPQTGVAQAVDGSFYGTTTGGGANFAGNVFQMRSGGALANLYSFTSGTDGSSPATLLTQDPTGFLFGTTTNGGANRLGSVFKVSTNGAFSTLYSFTGASDGAAPVGELTFGADGNFYGVTVHAGRHGFGTVFRMTSAGQLTTLYSFTGQSDGSGPNPLTQGTDGNLYGTTFSNTIVGLPFYGTIFKISTNGAFSTLYPLNYNDGNYPVAGLIQASDGNFYGTTTQGGDYGNGTVFRVTSGGALTTLVSFDGFDDGAIPETALAEGADGSLYGTTSSGGVGGQGTIFRLSMTSAPQITVPPASQTVAAGATAVFSVAAFGAPLLNYQWQKNGTNLVDGPNVSGSIARILSITPVALADAGVYSVIVSNSLGAATSAGASMTVLAPPVFQAVTKSNALITLAWSAVTGQIYRLQYKAALTAGSWSNLGGTILATNTTMFATDAITNAQRYYRAVLVP